MSRASDGVEAARALAQLPGVPEQVDAVREACTRLRWHQALRRRIPEAAAESRVRGAQASGELEGARLSVEIVRDIMRGAATWHDPPDPVERVMQGVVAVTAETEHLGPLVSRTPQQVLARLHTVAAAAMVPDDGRDVLGRPRRDGEDCRELLEVGPAPPAAEARARLGGVVDLLTGLADAPALVVAAVVHAEVAVARPFTHGNAVVARALERLVVHASGLDPTGVTVPEAGHVGGPRYLGSLTAYQRGDAAGVGMWITYCGQALVAAAEEGERIAGAVLAGRLG